MCVKASGDCIYMCICVITCNIFQPFESRKISRDVFNIVIYMSTSENYILSGLTIHRNQSVEYTNV